MNRGILFGDYFGQMIGLMTSHQKGILLRGIPQVFAAIQVGETANMIDISCCPGEFYSGAGGDWEQEGRELLATLVAAKYQSPGK